MLYAAYCLFKSILNLNNDMKIDPGLISKIFYNLRSDLTFNFIGYFIEIFEYPFVEST